ncbi:hypothetical protein [Flavobacterium restrictum]|uniref:Uncharacterized protein n=1 Tax=Flavobacterium restrictum TaxID=2594428 RepID=A0A553DY35_9FLAO|nr:hypothetical protein [Flavobacterium restrictum]TRX37573.1 hypothetical protein FNW21_12375 [Flavobacterium restrictum]
MNKIKSILIITFTLFISNIYGQEGFNVDKDNRIKKHQKDIIKFLIDNNEFRERAKKEIIISDYSGNMGVTKCMEIFNIEPQNKKVLLVRFYSFRTGAESYWGILEKNSKYFFYYDQKDTSKIDNYLKKYDLQTQKIVLDYVKIYTELAGPNTHSSQVINADLKK